MNLQIMRVVGFLVSFLFILSACDKPLQTKDPEKEHTPWPSVQVSKNLPTQVKVGSEIDLSQYVSSDTKPIDFKIIAGKAELSGSKMTVVGESDIVVQATDSNNSVSNLVFHAIKPLTILKPDTSNDLPASLNRGSFSQVVVEGGVKPYHYSLVQQNSGEVLKSTIDQTGHLQASSKTGEVFQIVVEDSEGTKALSGLLEVREINPWTHDEGWAANGVIPGTGSAITAMKLSLDQKFLLVLEANAKGPDNSSGGMQVSLYNLADGKIVESFGVGGHYTLFETGSNLAPVGFELQSDGKIIVLIERSLTSLPEIGQPSGWEHILIRLDQEGHLDTSFEPIMLSKLLGVTDTLKFAGHIRMQVGKSDKIFLSLDDGQKAILLSLQKDGKINKSFGDSGVTHLPSTMGVSAFAISPTQIIAVGSYYGEDRMHTLPSMLAVTAFDLSGHPKPNFGEQNPQIIDLDHRPAMASLPMTEADSISLDPNGDIFVTGQTWNTPYMVKMDSTGTILSKQVISSAMSSRDSRPTSSAIVAGHLFVVLGNSLVSGSPLWMLTPYSTDSMYYGIEQIDPLKNKIFKVPSYQFMNELPWYMSNHCIVLPLPDGTFLMTVSGGIVRILP